MFSRTSEDPEVLARGSESFAELLARVDEGQAAELIAPGDPLAAAGVLWAAVHGFAELCVAGSIDLVSAGDPDALLERLLDTLLRGLAESSEP